MKGLDQEKDRKKLATLLMPLLNWNPVVGDFFQTSRDIRRVVGHVEGQGLRTIFDKRYDLYPDD